MKQTGKTVKNKTAESYTGSSGMPHNKKHSKNYTPDIASTAKKR